MNSLRLLAFAMLFLSQIPSLFAFQPSGGVLVLDGIDDYAILPFEEHGLLIPRGSGEYTVEAWLYPKSQAESEEREIILSQQVAFESWPSRNPWFSFEEDEGNACVALFAYVQAGGGVVGAVDFYVTLKKNQWSYLALLLKDGNIGAACNQMIKGRATGIGGMVLDDMNRLARPKDFVVGGYREELEEWGGLRLSPPSKVTYFQGYIDAIRVSDMARYDFPVGWEQPFDPPHHFENDGDTLALWNFDDGERTTLFSDASGKKHTLIGKNGAQVHGWLPVESLPSISTTWGQIKLFHRSSAP